MYLTAFDKALQEMIIVKNWTVFNQKQKGKESLKIGDLRVWKRH